MTGKKRFAAFLFVMVGVMVLCCCASGNNQQKTSGAYDKMIDLQKRKAMAVRAEEPDLPAGFEATAETHEKMGDAYARQGDTVSALTEYQKSLEKNAQRTSPVFKTGMIFLGKGLTDEAIAEFDKVLTREPQNASAWYGRGRARFQQKK